MSKFFYFFATVLKLRKKSLLLFILFKIKTKIGLIRRRVVRKDYGKDIHVFKIGAHKLNSFYDIDDFNSKILSNAEELRGGKLRLFKSDNYVRNFNSDWFAFPEHSEIKPWCEIPINSIPGHDIKLTWERSRFNWLVDLGAAYKITGDDRWINLASSWFKDWLNYNPYNYSINWVCGQECSIRALNLLLFFELSGIEINSSMSDFFKLTVDRVALTLDYAVAQDNNHAISESSAIFVLSSFLINSGLVNDKEKTKYKKLSDKSKSTLIKVVRNLTLKDGGFAMYSTNYHRVVLNVLSLVEYFNRTLCLSEFNSEYYDHCKKLVFSLYDFVNENSGKAINLGANDGSLLFFSQIDDYNDYRPSIQVASYFFTGKLLYRDFSANSGLYILGVDFKALDYHEFDNAVFHRDYKYFGITKYVLTGNVSFFIKYPVYIFRPSHCDIFHIDLWIGGENYLRDLGSYSYNDNNGISAELASIKMHNTVCVDELPAMPRLGRFLLGCWPSVSKLRVSPSQWTGEYKSVFGYTHAREIKVDNSIIYITDRVCNVKKNISINFNLPFDCWSLSDGRIENSDVTIEFKSSDSMKYDLIDGVESLYYNRLSKISRLFIQVFPTTKFVRVETKITIKDN
nr:heparinase II/III family protein [Plesiomonas shigelloides]